MSNPRPNPRKVRPPFSVRARLDSFGPALRGVALLLRGEHNARIHVIAAFLAFVLGLIFQISRGEWLAIVLTVGLVLALEGINTAIEAVGDAVTTDYDPRVRDAKDAAAGAVLIAACIAVAMALLVFVPKILAWLPAPISAHF